MEKGLVPFFFRPPRRHRPGATSMCIYLAHSPTIFTADMTTYYCPNMEEALRRAKKAGREAGCYFGGITLRSGRRGFAVYKDGKVVAQYTAIGRR